MKTIIVVIVVVVVGRDSSVGIGTRYRLDCPGIESWLGRHIPLPSTPALGITQSPIEQGPGPFLEVKTAGT